MMYVVTFCRLAGGLKMVLRSRIPVRDMCSVRGIGVAVRVSTSTPVVKTLRRVRGDAKKKEKRGREEVEDDERTLRVERGSVGVDKHTYGANLLVFLRCVSVLTEKPCLAEPG